ncbi:primosomal protein N' [Vulgatibacter sp.]|uniref:replication restart helicase PriA n=1 Tax=Vulgatibacter sp. TaxID=1971226 RepID=UPI003568D0AC
MRIEVAVGAPVRGTFTYEADDALALEPGRRLVVPFGRRRAIGFYLGPATAAPEGQVKAVEQVLDDGPVFPEDVLALLRFAADYYLYPLGEALRGALPPDLGRVGEVGRERSERAPAIEAVELIESPEVARAALGRSRSQAAIVEHLAARGGSAPVEELKLAVKGAPALLKKLEERGLVRLVRVERKADDAAFRQEKAHPPTPAQARACEEIGEALGRFETFLLHGVTGSGKTEVYLRVIAEARAKGKGALVLVPEIALTPQLAGRFRSRFGPDVAVLHSGLSDRERSQEFRRLLSGEARIAVGVRSAVFAPVRDLGIVIVDEEHEPSFKQEEKLRYHARDLAVYRARLLGVPCVLGSATPSLETLKNARDGRYRLVELRQRVDSRPLPEVELVDLSRKGRRAEPPPGAERAETELVGPTLAAAIEETLAAGKQTILFLNRRGNASMVVCAACGEGARCHACDVALTHHLHRNELRCHYCDYRVRKPDTCPSCNGELLVLGIGTERLEQELARRFPDARTLRLDRDAAGTSAELTRILASFARGEADVLVGTQMVAKGHDFPGVTLVGVILADVGLGLPDFRASERTFQLLAQVAGRAGRGRDAGRVVVQTFNPGAEAIACVRTHDFETFAGAELERRRELGYPPFRRMLALRLEGEDGVATERFARRLAEAARKWTQGGGVQVLGPAPAPIAKLRGRMRFQVLVLGDGVRSIQTVARRLAEVADQAPPGVKVALDVDPASML